MASKPSPLKVTYFDGRGRGEILRLILAKGGKQFEDERIGFEGWPAHKPKTPLGFMPVLNVNGKEFSQGLAIAIYLARECNLYTSSNLDNLMIDQILMSREDIVVPESKIKFEKDASKHEGMIKDLFDGAYPKIFGLFEKAITDNPTKSGFAVGKGMTLADLVIFDVTYWIMELKADLMKEKFPKICALVDKVKSDKNIKAYLEKRKVTPF